MSMSCKTASSCFKRSVPHILSTSSSEIEKTTNETQKHFPTVTNHLFHRFELCLTFIKIVIRVSITNDIVICKVNGGEYGVRANALHSDNITLF